MSLDLSWSLQKSDASQGLTGAHVAMCCVCVRAYVCMCTRAHTHVYTQMQGRCCISSKLGTHSLEEHFRGAIMQVGRWMLCLSSAVTTPLPRMSLSHRAGDSIAGWQSCRPAGSPEEEAVVSGTCIFHAACLLRDMMRHKCAADFV